MPRDLLLRAREKLDLRLRGKVAGIFPSQVVVGFVEIRWKELFKFSTNDNRQILTFEKLAAFHLATASPSYAYISRLVC